MAVNVTKLLKYLFPEYQVIACIEERGFIVKAAHGADRPRRPHQTHGQGTVHQAVPASAAACVQGVLVSWPEAHVQPESVQGVPADPQSVRRQKTSSISPEKSVQKAPAAMESSAPCAQAEVKMSSVPQKDQSCHKSYTPMKIDDRFRSRANDAFGGLSDALKKYWAGSEKGRVAVCRAYQRPYIRGFDIQRSRNAILLISPGDEELVCAVRGVSELLLQKKVFRYAGVSAMNIGKYASDTSNGLFVKDLYTAFTAETETVLLEHIEQASSSQMDIIYQLLRQGRYGKDGQDSGDGSLSGDVDAADTGKTSEIAVNGKYVVFTTTVPQAKITAFLGNRFVRELGDIIVLDVV